MELSDIRKKIDAVDDQLLRLFLERMDLSDEVAAYKSEHRLPILNRERERSILNKVTAAAGERERYAYHLFSTLFELARSRQAELMNTPTRVAEQVKTALGELEDFSSQECAGIVEELLRHALPQDVEERLAEIQKQLKLYEDDYAEELLRQLLGEFEKEIEEQ